MGEYGQHCISSLQSQKSTDPTGIASGICLDIRHTALGGLGVPCTVWQVKWLQIIWQDSVAVQCVPSMPVCPIPISARRQSHLAGKAFFTTGKARLQGLAGADAIGLPGGRCGAVRVRGAGLGDPSSSLQGRLLLCLCCLAGLADCLSALAEHRDSSPCLSLARSLPCAALSCSCLVPSLSHCAIESHRIASQIAHTRSFACFDLLVLYTTCAATLNHKATTRRPRHHSVLSRLRFTPSRLAAAVYCQL